MKSLLTFFLSIVLATTSSVAQVTFSNTSYIAIPDDPSTPIVGSPYPSAIEVSGLVGTVSSLTVTLYGFRHTFPDAVDIMLVSPNGTSAIVLSDVGGAFDVSNINLTLKDSAAANLPDNATLSTGVFKPTNIGGSDLWPSPAPASTGQSSFTIFNGLNPNGTWQLYVVSDADGSAGAIEGGWSLSLQTMTVLPVAPINFFASLNSFANQVVLRWSTARVGAGASFAIESSPDGVSWIVIGSMRAFDNSFSTHTYEFKHPASTKEQCYRIKYFDAAGYATYSPIVRVKKQGLPFFDIYYTRAYNSICISSKITGTEKVLIQLIDLMGRVVVEEAVVMQGSSEHRMKIPALREAIFFIRIAGAKHETTKKMVVGL